MNGPIVKSMDAAYQQEQKDNNVARVVQQHFPTGMNVADALNKLQENGFEVYEYTHEGERQLPNGKIYLYRDTAEDKARQKAAGVAQGNIEYVAENKYERIKLIYVKRAVITVRTDGNQVLDARGFIYVDGI